MGTVTSYTKEKIDLIIAGSVIGWQVIGTDIILTKGDLSTVTIPIPVDVTQAELDGAIAALVNSSPATLNTLNELAAALGNDPNYAATITASLAAKASIAALDAETTARTAADTAEATARANADTAVMTGAMGVAIHGANAAYIRPGGYGAIHWVGSVAPTNAIDNDVWTDTSA